MILAMWTRLVRVDLVFFFFFSADFGPRSFLVEEKNQWIFQRFEASV